MRYIGVLAALVLVLALWVAAGPGAQARRAAARSAAAPIHVAAARRVGLPRPMARPTAPPRTDAASRERIPSIETIRLDDREVVVCWSGTGEVRHLYGVLSRPSSEDPVRCALAFLEAHGDLWGVADAARDLSIVTAESSLTPDDYGTTHVLFAQVLSGVPLHRRGLFVNLARDGSVTSAGGSFDREAVGAELPAGPKIDGETAIRIVRSLLVGPLSEEPIARDISWKNGSRYHRAWAIEVYSLAGGFGREYIVDASDGTVLETTSLSSCALAHERLTPRTATGVTSLGNRVKIHAQWDGLDYLLLDDRGQGTAPVWVFDAKGMDAYRWKLRWSDTYFVWDRDGRFDAAHQRSGVTVLRNMRKALTYWKTWLGRASWNTNSDADQPRGVICAVDAKWGASSANAESLGNGLFAFGGGNDRILALDAFDMVAHELAHGMVSGVGHLRARLGWNGRVKAVGEHIADAFAVFAERRMGNESHGWNWTIGEEMATPALGARALRSLSDPPSVAPVLGMEDIIREYPDHMREVYPYLMDDYGAHINCGILSKWLYLWIRGGMGPSAPGPAERRFVPGLIGPVMSEEQAFALAERVYYQGVRHHLIWTGDAREDFYDFRAGMIAAIREVTGEAHSFAEFQALAAFQAIGLAESR